MKIEKIDVKQERAQNVFLKVAFSAGKRGFDDAKLRTLELVAKTSCVCDRNAISRAITLLEFGGTGLGVFAVEGPVGDDAEETDGEATAETVVDAE